jgi:ABC-2 type transport system permease protein
MINRATETARDRFAEQKTEFDKEFREEEAGANAVIQQKIQEITEKMEQAKQSNDIAEQERLMAKFRQEALVLGRKNRATMEKLNRARDSVQKQIERQLNQDIISVQNFYKALAVCLPPIPPMLVGLIVFWKRRKRELVGVIDERLRLRNTSPNYPRTVK